MVHQVIDEIQHRISLGEYVVGGRLPTEDELTRQLSVSRTTLREAVRILSHIGLLDVRQGDGTYVREVAPTGEPLEQRLRRSAALEVYQVRQVLELETARLAALHRSDADVVELARLLEAREAARSTGDQAALVATDIDFHTRVAMAGGNAVLADLFRVFAQVLRSTVDDVLKDPALPDSGTMHRDLLEAIRRSDPVAAVHATDQLLQADIVPLRRALNRS